MDSHLFSKNKIIDAIIEDIINKSIIISENKPQNIKLQKFKDLDEETQTIIHISSTKPTEIHNHKIIQSPIYKQYNPKLKICSPPKTIKSYPVSSTSTSASTSMCTSSGSSIATSMVSSLDSSEANQLFCSNIKVTDSFLSGISISESDTICDDNCDSESSEEFQNLKESLNRQWNENQLALS
eukprot:UN08282